MNKKNNGITLFGEHFTYEGVKDKYSLSSKLLANILFFFPNILLSMLMSNEILYISFLKMPFHADT